VAAGQVGRVERRVRRAAKTLDGRALAHGGDGGGVVESAGGGRRVRGAAGGRLHRGRWLLLLLLLYCGGWERGRGVWGSIGCAVERRIALLALDALAGGCQATLVPSVMLGCRVLPPLSYHRRRCAGKRGVSPSRLDCCTGRASLEEGRRWPRVGKWAYRSCAGVLCLCRERDCAEESE
jgi:hypothetical protein